MSGVYGDVLLAFPEQLKRFTVFSMTAKINGGWDVDKDSQKEIQGLYHHTEGKTLKDSNGNLVKSSIVELWTQSQGLSGMFTKINGVLFRLKSDNDWNNEGGFTRYTLEKVIGNGAESEVTAWNFGKDNFS